MYYRKPTARVNLRHDRGLVCRHARGAKGLRLGCRFIVKWDNQANQDGVGRLLETFLSGLQRIPHRNVFVLELVELLRGPQLDGVDPQLGVLRRLE